MTLSPFSTAVLCAALPASIATLGYWTYAGPPAGAPVATVSQKGRAFSIGSINLRAGDSIRIVNDDADLHHHAYIDSNAFKFDSGDQEPGQNADITFPVSGVFTVQCGIHPKMKLVVTVK